MTSVKRIFCTTRIGFSAILQCTGIINKNPYPWHSTVILLRTFGDKRDEKLYISFARPVPLNHYLGHPALLIKNIISVCPPNNFN